MVYPAAVDGIQQYETIFVDINNPSLKFDSGLSVPSNTNSAVTLSGTVSDTNPLSVGESGTLTVKAYVNGNEVTGNGAASYDKTAGTWSFTVPAPVDHSGDGSKTIKIVATDIAGKTSETTATTTIDTKVPTVGAVEISNSETGYITGTFVDLKVSASDDGSGVDTVKFSINGKKKGETETSSIEENATIDGSYWTYRLLLSDWEEGLLSVSATAKDKAKNSAASDTPTEVTIDQNKPVASSIVITVKDGENEK